MELSCALSLLLAFGGSRPLGTLAASPSGDLLADWTWIGHELALEVHFQESTRWVTGFASGPEDRVALALRDFDRDGQTDVVVAVSGASGSFVHHVALTRDLPMVLSLASVAVADDLVSDRDNFGFGSGSVPCAFFDNSDPVVDLGIFDREASGGDPTDTWVHDLSGTSLPTAPAPILFQLQIRETFSDPGVNSTIAIDGRAGFLEIDGTDCTGGCACTFGTVHTISTVLTAYAFLADGQVVVTFEEHGDDIGLDYSYLTISAL